MQNSTANKPNVIGLLLAAGQGSRFGGHKLRHVLDNGTAMGLQSALNLKESVDEVVCVVRPDDSVLTDIFKQHGFTTIENPEHLSGLSSSIGVGVEATPDSDYWVIALGDMPYIHMTTYELITQSIQQEHSNPSTKRQIIRPRVETKENRYKAGHPVAFPNRFRNELIELAGDKGASPILKQHSDEVRWVSVNDDGVAWDVDNREMLAGYKG